jgi:hypothetical protein
MNTITDNDSIDIKLAIVDSIAYDRVAYLEWTPGREIALIAESDDHAVIVDHATGLRYMDAWGGDDEDSEWRICLTDMPDEASR